MPTLEAPSPATMKFAATHPCRHEVRHLLEVAKRLDWTPTSLDDGGDEEEIIPADMRADALAAHILGVDCCNLFLGHTSGARANLFLVLGNDPEELIADFNVNPQVEALYDEFDKTLPAPLKDPRTFPAGFVRDEEMTRLHEEQNATNSQP
jgi:hypothetical protein